MRFDENGSNESPNGTQPYANGDLSLQARKSTLSNKPNGHSSPTNGTQHDAIPESLSRVQRMSTYFGHDREEVTRLIIQGLSDLGYLGTADMLSRESGYELESPSVAAFRMSILNGEWFEAERLLFGASTSDHEPSNGVVGNGTTGAAPKGLILAEGADKNEMLFWLRQQKFLELLEQRDLGSALTVLRNELTPLRQDVGRLHALSSLLMCHSPDDLRTQANWDGAKGHSREDLLTDLSRYVSPSVMLPQHRLAILLDQVKQTQIDRCLYHNTIQSPSLYYDHKCDKDEFPLSVAAEIKYHVDEVWYLQFSHDGSKLASASKDQNIFVYDTTEFKVVNRLRGHSNSVTFLTWSPDDTKIISCSWDNTARVWDLSTGGCILTINHHNKPVTSAAWTPDGTTFLTGSLDRESQLCLWDLQGQLVHSWKESYRVQDLRLSPDGRRLITLSTEDKVHVYNFISREQEYTIPYSCPLTCLTISADSKYVLINLADDQIQLLNLDAMEVERTFKGQKQGKFVIRSAFGGAGENYVVSGSEDAMVYIWHRRNGVLIAKLEGHTDGCVNAVSWNSKNPRMLASAGDDSIIRIWSNDGVATKAPFGKRKSMSNNVQSEDRTEQILPSPSAIL